tara:strand:- start:1856 stop:2104 length:249 start_codon:yes stop_codon:yes gene_type:complete
MKKLGLAPLAIAGFLLTGCATGGKNQTIGTFAGAAGGALLGSQIGGGTGQIVGTALGTLGGALAGGAIGKNMDDSEKTRSEK